MKLSVTFYPTRLNVSAKQDTLGIQTGSQIVREYVGGEPYEGDYIVTPRADIAVILPTTNKILHDDVTVKRIAYYETANPSGETVYIASEV